MCVNLKAIREYCYIGTGHEVQFTRPLKFGIYTAHAELKNQTNQTKQTVKKNPYHFNLWVVFRLYNMII